MIKKSVVSILFISVVFMLFLGLNELNSEMNDKKFILEHTPDKFESIISDFENDKFEDTKVIMDNLKNLVYRQYMLTPDNYGFILGTMGYEEEMLVYIEAEYVDSSIIINLVEVLYENETDGYGDYVVEPWFLDRFKLSLTREITLVKRKKTEEHQVIAITGATITSEAIVDAVNECRQIMEDSKNENE